MTTKMRTEPTPIEYTHYGVIETHSTIIVVPSSIKDVAGKV
jgi:hypothetical protein